MPRLTKGFTLLEVMVALAILGVSLTTLSRSQQMSARTANRAKWMTVAVMLARYKMVEVEDTLFKEGFSDFEEEDDGDFKDEDFEKFFWELKIDKVELPKSVDANAIENAVEDSTADTDKDDKTGGGPESAASSIMNMGSKMLAQQFEMVRNVLEQSIRRVEVKVYWKEGSQRREVTVSSYFTDPRKIGAATGTGVNPQPR